MTPQQRAQMTYSADRTLHRAYLTNVTLIPRGGHYDAFSDTTPKDRRGHVKPYRTTPDSCTCPHGERLPSRPPQYRVPCKHQILCRFINNLPLLPPDLLDAEIPPSTFAAD